MRKREARKGMRDTLEMSAVVECIKVFSPDIKNQMTVRCAIF